MLQCVYIPLERGQKPPQNVAETSGLDTVKHKVNYWATN